MNAMSVFFAIKDAIASVGDYKITPIINAPFKPGPFVTAIASIFSMETLESIIALSTTLLISDKCSLDAISGTTPPYSL